MITNDSPSFSLAIRPAFLKRGSEVAAQLQRDRSQTNALDDDAVSRYLAASVADATWRAYRGDLDSFLAWGGTLPAAPANVAAYLASQASTKSPETLARRLVAIGQVHAWLGYPNPCRSPLVNRTMRGIRRVNGRPQRGVRPALYEDVLAMLAHMRGLRGVRDRALILIGFAGALRRCELVAIDRSDIEFGHEGLVLLVRRSKTDPGHRGRSVAVPFGKGIACPVTALTDWLSAARIESGPVFRTVNKGGIVGGSRLSDQAVALLVKEYAHKTALPSEHYSGHSLRAGLTTSAAKAGVSSWKICQTTGHKSEAMLQRYIRDAEIFEGNAAGSVL